jgi:hypothetical protein
LVGHLRLRIDFVAAGTGDLFEMLQSFSDSNDGFVDIDRAPAKLSEERLEDTVQAVDGLLYRSLLGFR